MEVSAESLHAEMVNYLSSGTMPAAAVGAIVKWCSEDTKRHASTLEDEQEWFSECLSFGGKEPKLQLQVLFLWMIFCSVASRSFDPLLHYERKNVFICIFEVILIYF